MTWQHVSLVGLAVGMVIAVVRICAFTAHGCDNIVHEVMLVALAIISGAVGNAMPQKPAKLPQPSGEFYRSGDGPRKEP